MQIYTFVTEYRHQTKYFVSNTGQKQLIFVSNTGITTPQSPKKKEKLLH